MFQNPDQGDEEEADEERMDEGTDLHFSVCSTGLTNLFDDCFIVLLFCICSQPASCNTEKYGRSLVCNEIIIFFKLLVNACPKIRCSL